MKWINYILFILIIPACALRKPVENDESKQVLTIDNRIFEIQNSDSLKIISTISIPLHWLVFIKVKNKFEGKINANLKISDPDDDHQIYRYNWSESITKEFYEETREKSDKYAIDTSYYLPEGDYNLSVIIEDKDSHRSWSKKLILQVSHIKGIGDILLYFMDENEKQYIENELPENIESLWLQFQLSQVNNQKIIEVEVKTIQDSKTIDVQIYYLERSNIDNIFTLQHPIDPGWEGEFEFELEYLDFSKRIELYVNSNKETALWSTDNYELTGVMAYILSYTEIKAIYDLSDAEQTEFVFQYWADRDPSPETKKNELLEEINDRFWFTNTHFSVMGKGWRSDRGRIYLKYGPPENIENRYDRQSNINIEIWYYSSMNQFIFSDRGMFSDYKLINR